MGDRRRRNRTAGTAHTSSAHAAGRDASFAGRAVLRSCGRSTAYPIAPMRYEIRRQRVGEEYWFPASIRADEDARTDDNPVHLRVNVEYSDYKAR